MTASIQAQHVVHVPATHWFRHRGPHIRFRLQIQQFQQPHLKPQQQQLRGNRCSLPPAMRLSQPPLLLGEQNLQQAPSTKTAATMAPNCNICGCHDCNVLNPDGYVTFVYQGDAFRYLCRVLEGFVNDKPSLIDMDFCVDELPKYTREPCHCARPDGSLLTSDGASRSSSPSTGSIVGGGIGGGFIGGLVGAAVFVLVLLRWKKSNSSAPNQPESMPLTEEEVDLDGTDVATDNLAVAEEVPPAAALEEVPAPAPTMDDILASMEDGRGYLTSSIPIYDA